MKWHGGVATCSVIARDLPIAIPWDHARYETPASGDLYVLYRDLEFKSLLARLPAPAASGELALAVTDDAELVRGAYRSFVPSTDPPEFVLLATMLADAARAERVGNRAPRR